VATSVRGSAGGGETLLILDNEHTRAQPVVIRDAHNVRIAVLNTTRAGLQTEQLSSPRGRIKLVVAGNSVVAVSSSP
jgi:hypothetical protein